MQERCYLISWKNVRKILKRMRTSINHRCFFARPRRHARFSLPRQNRGEASSLENKQKRLKKVMNLI